MKITSSELRQKYLDFFKSKGHTIIKSASLIPENDATTLFISSGMQPLVPYLLGEKHPEGVCLVNSQKSFRAEDIEEVGDNRHNTFFEMLGNWSLGDYFKKEQLSWIFEFLINELDLNPNRLYVSVFSGDEKIGVPRDNESVEIWKENFKKIGIEAKDIDFAEQNGMQNGKIFYYNAKKNWWSRSGAPTNMPIGEIGGPDSELFYDLGANLKRHENSPWKNKPCHINCDCGRFIEIGNSVFMEYKRTKEGFEKLKQHNVDFGGGLERITMIVQGYDNIFETDLFNNILIKIKDLSEKKYRENMKAFEVIADHIKAATFIIGDDKGIAPSNLGQGYIVRRLIRRAIRYGRQLGIKKASWIGEIGEVIINDYKSIYKELERNKTFILDELKKEEEKFANTLDQGLKEFEKLIKGFQLAKEKTGIAITKISGDKVFKLYDTFGFPIEMTEELAKENSLEIDKEGFKVAFEHHQELSRTASAGVFKGGLADSGEETKKLHTAAHLMLAGLRNILGDKVFQKGSNITAERLRFDFSYDNKITSEQIKQVEDFVNKSIQDKLPVICEKMSLKEAKNKGAMGVFESKYEEKVKVYTIGNNSQIVSKEICGGPHVINTGELGKFKIIKEESSSAGVRRIKAILEN